MSLPTDRNVAYHEAAHAVAAVALGWTLRGVTIVPGPVQDGWCEVGSCTTEAPGETLLALYRAGRPKTAAQLDAEQDRRRNRQHAVILSAGRAGQVVMGEERAAGSAERAQDELASPDTDLGAVYRWAGYRGDGPISAPTARRVRAVDRQALRLLSTPPARRAVAALAAALMERRTVSDTDAEAIIRRARWRGGGPRSHAR